LETAKSQLEPSQESAVDGPWQRCFSLLKIATHEAKNMLAYCHGEKLMSDHSPQLSSLFPHGISKPFQHLHIECLINSGPFRYKFEVDYAPDVEKADQNCFDLGL
jgi:hypothetical protein